MKNLVLAIIIIIGIVFIGFIGATIFCFNGEHAKHLPQWSNEKTSTTIVTQDNGANYSFK